MQQVAEVLALWCDMEYSLIPLREGEGGGVMEMGLFLTPFYPRGPLSMQLGFKIHIMLEEE